MIAVEWMLGFKSFGSSERLSYAGKSVDAILDVDQWLLHVTWASLIVAE